jgi:hypothetical protein
LCCFSCLQLPRLSVPSAVFEPCAIRAALKQDRRQPSCIFQPAAVLTACCCRSSPR